jgi:hypothetical protein
VFASFACFNELIFAVWVGLKCFVRDFLVVLKLEIANQGKMASSGSAKTLSLLHQTQIISIISHFSK